MARKTNFSERKIFRSSIHIHMGGSRSRSIDETGSIDYHVDLETKKLVNTALNPPPKETTPEFVTKPKRQFVNEGETAKFKVAFEGSPATELSWSVGGKQVMKDDRHKMYEEKDNHILEICKVVAADKGIYVCTIHNSAGSNTAEAELEIFVRPKTKNGKASKFVPPTVDIGLEDTEFADKEKDATLTCKFHNGIDGTAKWYKDGREVGSWQAKTTYDGRTARLVLKDAIKRVCGVYECIVKNSGGEAKTRALVSLLDAKVKPTPPQFTVTLSDTSIESGEKLVLETQVTGKPRPSLKWYKDNTELGSSQDIRMEYKDGKGRLIVDHPDDTSKYTCVAHNVAGEAKTQSSVNVAGCDTDRDPPIFTKELHNMEVTDGDRVELSVEVKGTPPIDIVWVHNNREIPPTDPVCRMIRDGSTHTLVIPEVFPEDSGEYVCEAYNDYGDTDTFCTLDVHEEADDTLNAVTQNTPPEFVIPPQKELNVTTGTSAILTCHVTGNPPPSIQWLKGTQNIKHGNKYKISSVGEEHCLEITSASADDTGQYTCTLCNITGTTSAITHITVPSTVRSSSRTRSHNPRAIRHNITESESSDISTKSEPVPSHTSAIEINYEPVTPKFKTFQLNAEPTLVKATVIQTETEPISVNTETAIKRNSVPEDTKSDTQKRKSEPGFSKSYDSKRNSAPTIEQKGGLNQLDFRGVLKNRNNTKKPLEEKDSVKLPKGQDSKKNGVDITKSVLSNKRSLFEKSEKKVFTPNSVPSKSIPNGYIGNGVNYSGGKTGKINQVLQKFETKEKVPTSQTDFRNVLKHSKEVPKDFRSVRSNDKASANVQNNAIEVPKVFRIEQSNNTDSNRDKSKQNDIKRDFTKDKSNTKEIKKGFTRDQYNTKEIEASKVRANSVTQVRKSLDLKKFPSQEIKDLESPKQNIAKPIPVQEIKPQNPKLKINIPTPGKSDFVKSANNFHNQAAKVRDIPVSDKKKTPTLIRQNSGSFGLIPGRRMSSSENTITSIGSKPEFRKSPGDQSVSYGHELVIQCEVDGTPNPEVTWSVNDKEIKQSKYFCMSYTDSIARLEIAEVFSEDEGEYTCRAHNSEGQSSVTCNLHVQDRPLTPSEPTTEEPVSESADEPFSPTATPPKIYNISPSEFCILRGGAIEFKASYTSVPAGMVTWSKNRKTIVSNDRLSIETSDHFSTLTINDIQPGDSGKFDFIVHNDLGSDSLFASLTVQDVPEPPVGQPWVSEVTLKAATLSWYGPAYDGGCSVTNYRVEMCDAEDQHWIPVTSTCVDTTFRINNLTAHTPYFFRIFAENRHGVSLPCQTSDVTVTTDRRPSTLQRLPSTESDDVFMHETHEHEVLFTPTPEYGLVSPLSPDEIPFEHKERQAKPGRSFEEHYNCMQEVGKGKFGSVYKCEEKSTGKIWAAKVLKCREGEKKKIQMEIDIMNELKHSKILMLWDVFDVPRKIILVMEYIGGGELFERVIDDDFELTERDCIQFMRQICDAVHYMHGKNILHLDLKPENVLCVKNESNKIKIIDFGLARFYKKNESVRVLFGTPEFIAPEVVNYDEIGYTTDMWSIGVICYVLLTGLSPFMGDSDAETLSNVTMGDYDFEDETFDCVSDDGKNFIERLLVKNKKKRMTSLQALDHKWLAQDAARMQNRKINTKNLKRFMLRRRWQKTGNAIRALGRITSLQKLLKGGAASNTSSASSDSNTGSASTCSSLSSHETSHEISRDSVSLPNVSQTASSAAAAQNISNPLKVGETEEIEVANHNEGNCKFTNQMEGNLKLTNEINGKPPKVIMDESNKSNDTKDVNSNNKTVMKTNSLNSAFTSNEDSGYSESVRLAKCNDCERVSDNRNKNSDYHNRNKTNNSTHPEFTKEMVDSKAFPGDAVRFDVEYEADATCNVSWCFEDEPVHEDSRHCIQELNGACSLIIKDVCEDDDGEYLCKIEQNNNEITCSAELIVYGAI